MTDQPYTPTETTVRYWYIYARRASAEFNLEQVPDTSEAWAEFDRWLAAIEAAAEQRGAEETLAYLIEDYPAYASHEEIRAWIQARLDHVRNADQIGGKICGLDGCESDEIAGHMQDGTLICYDCAREGEMEGGE